MALPSSGPISLNDVNIELGRSSGATISMNESAVRGLFQVASGAIGMSNGYGKANIAILNYTFSSNAANASLDVSSLPGYIAGNSQITITVGSGVYLYSTSTGNAGLTLTGGTSGDTITLVNNGYIMGRGGDAGSYAGNPGGPALSLGYHTTINNTNGSAYIGGGGGAGGGMRTYLGRGGGGAGGGNGSGGSGGAPGQKGGDGAWGAPGTSAGGGRIFPGDGGQGAVYVGSKAVAGYGPKGGGAGGGGANYSNGSSLSGGSANNPGQNLSYTTALPGGGGGWGASGGYGWASSAYIGGAGGRAVNLNGYTVTWVSGDTARVWGAVA